MVYQRYWKTPMFVLINIGLFWIYCLFDLNEMFELLHHFTTEKSMKMKNRPPSAHKELNSLWADGGRFFGSKMVQKVKHFVEVKKTVFDVRVKHNWKV